MCRWISYLGEPTLMHDFLYEGDRSLCAQAQHSHKAKLGVHGDGGGLAWYGNQECPGLYRHAGPAWADPNLRELTSQIEARLFFAHVRASTGAPNTFVNCHPFRYGKWIFMHNGQIGGFSELRRDLLQRLSDEAFDALQGSTDSELMFALMISAGLRDDPGNVIRETISMIEEMRQRRNISEPFRATFSIADGKSIWAVRWASDAFAPSLYKRELACGVTLASEPLDGKASDWTEVPANSFVTISLENNCPKIAFTPFLEGELEHV